MIGMIGMICLIYLICLICLNCPMCGLFGLLRNLFPGPSFFFVAFFLSRKHKVATMLVDEYGTEATSDWINTENIPFVGALVLFGLM